MAYTKDDIIKSVRSGPEKDLYAGMSDDALFERVLSVRPEIKGWMAPPPPPPPPPPSIYQQMKDLALQGYKRLAGEPVPPEQIQQPKIQPPPQVAEFSPEQLAAAPQPKPTPVRAAFGAVARQIKHILPPAATPSPLVYSPGQTFEPMQRLGAAARMKGAGLQINPEDEKALEEFTIQNFKDIVLFPAAIGVAAQGVGWYLRNYTLPGSIAAARKAIADGLVRNGVPRAQAQSMADEGLTRAVQAAKGGEEAPTPAEFVAVRKRAEKGFGKPQEPEAPKYEPPARITGPAPAAQPPATRNLTIRLPKSKTTGEKLESIEAASAAGAKLLQQHAATTPSGAPVWGYVELLENGKPIATIVQTGKIIGPGRKIIYNPAAPAAAPEAPAAPAAATTEEEKTVSFDHWRVKSFQKAILERYKKLKGDQLTPAHKDVIAALKDKNEVLHISPQGAQLLLQEVKARAKTGEDANTVKLIRMGLNKELALKEYNSEFASNVGKYLKDYQAGTINEKSFVDRLNATIYHAFREVDFKPLFKVVEDYDQGRGTIEPVLQEANRIVSTYGKKGRSPKPTAPEEVVKPSTTKLAPEQQEQFMKVQRMVLGDIVARGDIAKEEIATLVNDKARDGVKLREIVEKHILNNPGELADIVERAADEYHAFLQGVKMTAQAQQIIQAPPQAATPPAAPAPAVVEDAYFEAANKPAEIWTMPLERLQEKALAGELSEPTWKTPEQAKTDMQQFPNGEYFRKWEAEKAIHQNMSNHGVPQELINKYGLQHDVDMATDYEIKMREGILKEYTERRGGLTPIWTAVQKMGFINRDKLLYELGITEGKEWRGREFPDELAHLVRKTGRLSPGDVAQSLYQAGMIPENSVQVLFNMLQRDKEVLDAVKAGRDPLPIIRNSEIDPRDIFQYGEENAPAGADFARRKPPTDLPGQTMIPGTGPAMSTGKIVREINVDPDSFVEGFTAQPETPSLFSALDEAATAGKDADKAARGTKADASPTAPPIDQPPATPAPATFQPLTGDKQFKLWRVTEQLIEKFAKRFGEDKYRPRGAIGVYYGDTQNIFLQAANNIFVAAHEVAHFVDSKTNWFTQMMVTKGTTKDGKPIYDHATLPMRRLLTQMYFDFYGGASASAPLRTRLREGAAMMVEKAVEDPSIMDSLTWKPLYDLAVRPGGKYYNPTFAELIKDGQAGIKEYRALSKMQQVMARQTASDRKRNIETVFTKADKYLEETANDLHIFDVMDKHMGLTDKPESTHNAMQALKYVGAIGNVALEAGKGLYAVTPTGIKKVMDENIGDLFKKIKTAGHANYMDGWLIARRVNAGYERMDEIRVELMALTEGNYDIKNPNPAALKAWLDNLAMDPQEAALIKAEIRELAREYKEIALVAANDNMGRAVAKGAYEEGLRDFPELTKLAELHDQINEQIVNMLEEAGILSAERAQKMRDNKAYASFRRDILTIHTKDGQPVFRPVDNLGMLKKRVGSELAFAGPLHGLILNYQAAVKLAMVQNAKNKLYDMVLKDQEFFGSAFQKQDLKVKVNEDGSVEYPQLSNDKIMMARKGGKYYPMAVTDDALMDVLSENMVGPGRMEALEKAVRTMSRAFTKGTTGTYLPFFLVNLPMDAVSSFVQTRTGLKPFWDQGKTLMAMLKDDGSDYANYIREYMVLTGGRQTLAHMYDDNAPAAKAYERLTGQMEARDWAIAQGERLLDALSAPSKLSEDLTRGSEYARARMQGKDVFTALEMAGQVSAPFHHRGRMGGKLGRLWVSSVPYWNASTQVIAQMGKATQTPENRKRMAIAMAALAVGMIFSSYQIRRASEAQRRKLRGMHPDERGNAIWFPIPTAEARAAGTLGKVRVPENYAAAANLINMIIEEAIKENNFSAGEYFDAATEIVPDQWNVTAPRRMAFSILPWIIQPAIQVGFNKRTFPKVMDLTPKSLQRGSIERQYGENTSEIAKTLSARLGKYFGLNPIEIDFLIEGYLGGRTTRFVTGRMGTRSITNNFYQELYLNSMRDMEFYYNLRERLAALTHDFKEDVKNAAAEKRAAVMFPTDASVEEVADKANAVGIALKPPSELMELRKFKGYIDRIENRMARYRQLSRVKNPTPAAKMEIYQVRDAVLDDLDLLRQQYEKKALTK